MSKKLTARNPSGVALGSVEKVSENATARVSFQHIRPGEQSGWHRHEMDFVAVHFNPAQVTIEHDDGSTGVLPTGRGHVNWGDAGATHNVTNTGEIDMIAFEIEFKRPAAARAPARKPADPRARSPRAATKSNRKDA